MVRSEVALESEVAPGSGVGVGGGAAMGRPGTKERSGVTEACEATETSEATETGETIRAHASMPTAGPDYDPNWGVVEGRPATSTVDQAALDSDARIERIDRVAVLYGEITAATREFLAAVAESDRHRDWENEGFRSCAEWLAWQIGVTRGTANEKVRAARALEHLPLISCAMARGELSFSKVRALTRAATADTESELLEFARAGSAANLERLVRAWKTLSRSDEQKRERALHRSRSLSVFPDEDGMYVLRGRLSPEVGAILMRAIEAASDALFRQAGRDERAANDGGAGNDNPEPPEPAQLRADALGLLAERALAAGFRDSAPVSGSRAERYQVMLHVEAATLREQGEPGRSELEDGTRVSAEPSGHTRSRRGAHRSGFPRDLRAKRGKLRGGSRAMRAGSWSATTRTARCSMWVGRHARFRRRSAGRSRRETVAAASQAVGFASRMPITSCTGPTAETRICRTRS